MVHNQPFTDRLKNPMVHPLEVPVPDLAISGSNRHIRQEAWPVMAILLQHMALTGCSLTRELVYSYIRLYSQLDPLNPNIGKNIAALERRCQRSITYLARLGLIETQKIRLLRGNIIYVIAELTELGKAFCQAYGWAPVESDWDFLKKHHQGERQKKHSAAILLFAMHARARGWQVILIPKASGDKRLYVIAYDPDVKIWKGEVQAMVEVETKAANKKFEKWRLSQLSQHLTAVCALTPKRRLSLEREILSVNARCLSTDFQYLNSDLKAYPFSPNELWINVLHPCVVSGS